MNEKITSVLKALGFNKNETIVYLDLLAHTHSSALEIAKRTSLHRSNVYDILRFLEKKGVIQKSISDDKTTFTALEPSSILHYIKQKENELNDIMPALENIKQKAFSEEIATISYGIPGLRNSFQRMMEDKKEIRIFNSPTNIAEILGIEFMIEFHEWRIKNNIPLKVIYSRYCDRIKEAKKQQMIKIRCFPGETESLCPFVVCDKHIFFLLLTKPVTIIEITSRKVAETFEKNFDFTWEKLENIH